MGRQLIPLRKIVPNLHGIPFTPQMLDWISFHREFNGAAKAGALVKCGGRVYVDPPRFLEWMASNPRISPPVARSRRRPLDAAAKPLPTKGKRRLQPAPTKKPRRQTRLNDASSPSSAVNAPG